MKIDVWSDIACPWCAIGKKRLETALRQFEHAGEVQVVWHSFELDQTPTADRPHFASITELLAKKYGMSLAQAQAANDRVVAQAAAEGMAWDMQKVKPSATFDAHRLLQLAGQRGKQAQLMDRLMAAYFAEGQFLSDPAVLQKLAAEAGLDAPEVEAVLASERFAAEVRADEQIAAKNGITGVPFFVLGGRYAVSGAQPAAAMLQALTQAWNDASRENA
jgi:predicted DsbA family dithiol-disulfide isomerase